MPVSWKPTPGQVALIEREDAPEACVTGVVRQLEDGAVVVDLGTSPQPGAGCVEVVASFFAPDGLYRLHATASPHGEARSLLDLDVHDVERIQRRGSQRVRLAVPAILSDFDGEADPISVVGETIDVGTGGCRVHTDRGLPSGCDPTVTLQLPGGDSVSVLASVLQVEARSTGFDYRLVFLDVDDDTGARLASLVRAVGAPA